MQKREAEDGVSGLHLSFTTETEHVLSISAFSLPSPFTLTDKNTHLSHVSANCTNISRRRPESPFVCLCWSGRCSCSLKDSCFPWQPCHFLFNDLALASGESRGSWSHSSLKVECVCVCPLWVDWGILALNQVFFFSTQWPHVTLLVPDIHALSIYDSYIEIFPVCKYVKTFLLRSLQV